MAKFKNKHLKLRDNQRTYFGDGDDASLYFDGTQFRSSTTISGVTPTQNYHLTTKQYVDTEVATLSGSIGDTSQFVLTDGSRGFTSTISGVDPVASSDLVTKNYVDSQIVDVTKIGREALVTNDSNKVVTFSGTYPDTNYSISLMMSNIVDAEPAIYPMIVTAKSTTGFTALFSGDIDSNNYVLEWLTRRD